MRKNRFKFTAMAVICLLVTALLPTAARAGEKTDVALEQVIKAPSPAPTTTAGGAKTRVSLEQAIQIVKANFTIPAGYTQFSSGFNSQNGGQSFTLTWSSPGNTGGNFNAQVDATNGEIVSINQWKPEVASQSLKLPVLSVDQARTLGYKLLQRLIPSRVGALRPIENDQIINLNNYGPGTYTLRWQRYANNIPVEGDGVYMDIDYTSGQVTNYSLNWSNITLPEPRGIVSLEAATRAFTSAGMLELQYLLPSNYRPLAQKDTTTPHLVYRITHPSGGGIDAFSGQPLTLESGHYLDKNAAAMGGMGSGDQKADSSALTPQEQQEIEDTANLITQETAENLVKKLVFPDAPADLALRSANLEQDWSDPNTRLWSLNWSTPASSDTAPAYLSARVNARSGELVSFYLDLRQTTNGAVTIDRASGQKMAEEFIKKVAPDRRTQVRLTPNQDTAKIQPGSLLNFNYQRLVEGIPCPDNGIDIGVDPVLGRVISYNLDWDQVSFPAADKVIGIEKANRILLAATPLVLTYVREWGNDGTQEAVKLVYQPQGKPDQPDPVIIDGLTGQMLDWQGNPLTRQPQAYHFTDLAGQPGARQIALLGQAGLLGEYGNTFHPGENIRLTSLLRAMLGCRNGASYVSNLSDQEVVKQAVNLGWLKEAPGSNPLVSRQLLSQLMIRYLGVEYLAQINSMYKCPYQDVPASLQGYATLMNGLSLLPVSGSKFYPARSVTRAEAAVALVGALAAPTPHN